MKQNLKFDPSNDMNDFSALTSNANTVDWYNLEYISDKEMYSIIKLVGLMRRMHHKNLVLMNQVIMKDTCLHIHYCGTRYGPLSDIISRGISNEHVLTSIIYQLCEALLYLHENMRIIHRAICPSSIFIEQKGLVKLGKFNNCIAVHEAHKITDFPAHINDRSNTNVSFLPWYSPEMFEQEFYGYSYNCDVYSLGLALACVFTGRMPYLDCEPALILLKKIGLVDLPSLDVATGRPEASVGMREFYNMCTTHNPRERPNVETLLSHSWLQSRTHCSKSSWKKIISD